LSGDVKQIVLKSPANNQLWHTCSITSTERTI